MGGGEQAGPVENPYPRVLMGSIAHLRQAMLDADHLKELDAFVQKHGGPQPPFDPALRALQAAKSKKLAVWWEANSRDEIHRALDLAEEFGTSVVIVGGREAAKAADRLKAYKVPVVLRLNVPEEPRVPTEPEYRKKAAAERDEPLRVLAHRKAKWKEQLATAAALAKEGIPFAFATDGVTRLEDVPANLRKVLGEGLKPDDALAALTTHAAAIAGVERRLGTLEPGKLGHVIVMTAPFNEERAKVRYVLIDGLKFEVKPEDPARAKAKAKGGGFRGRRGEGTEKPGEEDQPDGTAPDSRPETPAKPQAAAKPDQSKSQSPKAEPAKPGTVPSGEMKKAATKPEEPRKVAPKPEEPRKVAPKPEEPRKAATKAEAKKAEAPPFVDVASELDEDRKPALHTGGSVLIKDATILTVTKGTIPKGSILVEKGKIKAVGKDVTAPSGVTVIDAAGLVAMPGIIDTHSHIAVQGGVNEGSLSVVPEVRVKDVVTGDDVAIYRALAGGTTTARLLHGSANTIGGQDAVAKLRYGKPGRELIVREGPQGVKFALGENVTRSPRRFPNTRMGVEAVIEKSFEEAKAYREMWDAYRSGSGERGSGSGEGRSSPVPRPAPRSEPQASAPRAPQRAAGERNRPMPPPRVDLRLEALAGILDGKIRIHSHCYRSDEILMLLRTAQKYGVRVQSLQHVLEGYKVAAEIAAHGASASTFSDWWAYKVEAYDAIPFNAALLTEAGANVCIKSDDAELMRHLNLEAAKMVKYGGVSEAQALAMITLNPARELGLEDRLGSIEVGKDADIVLFDAAPARRVRAMRAGADRRRGVLPASRAGRQAILAAGRSFEDAPGPRVAAARSIEVAAQPKGVFALVRRPCPPDLRPRHRGRDRRRRRRQDRGGRTGRFGEDPARRPDDLSERPGCLAGPG